MTTATIRVWKRRYKPAGWAELRTFDAPARLTPKRIYLASGEVFDRATGEEVLRVDVRINRSYTYRVVALDGAPIKREWFVFNRDTDEACAGPFGTKAEADKMAQENDYVASKPDTATKGQS